MGMGSRLCGNDGVRQGMVEPQGAQRAQRVGGKEPESHPRQVDEVLAELLHICDIVRHSGTFSFGDYPKDCDMSATFSAIGATFSDITATKCDMAAVGDGLTAEGVEVEWVGVIAES